MLFNILRSYKPRPALSRQNDNAGLHAELRICGRAELPAMAVSAYSAARILWFSIILIVFWTCFAIPQFACAWSSRTHVFAAREAGIKNPQYTYWADFTKDENKALLAPLHYHNAAPGANITPAYIEKYIVKEEELVPLADRRAYPIKVRVPHPAGVLYWKILDLYEQMKINRGWEYEYNVMMIAHYITDLSNPVHNFPHGDKKAGDGKAYPAAGHWAKKNHESFDSILEPLLPLDEKKYRNFKSSLTPIKISSADDLKKEISVIASGANRLALRCYRASRILTVDEALKQIALSVALLQAVIADTKRK